MSRFNRYITQVLVWLGIWLMIWVLGRIDLRFVRTNGPTFVLQVIFLFGLIYYAVPKLLFKNKYFYFCISIIAFISLSAFLVTTIGPPPPSIDRPPSPEIRRVPPFVTSRLFRQILLLSVTCLSAVIIETFTLAKRGQQNEAIAKAELMETELKFLKMQINPHFLFNALNNIYSLSVLNSEKTQEGINTLSLMLRYVLYDCELSEVPLKKELEYITHFIKLFKLKSSKEYNINLIEEVEDYSLMVTPMLFIPFIENSFKHSGIEKGKDSFVNISLKAKGKEVRFSVENSLPSEQHITDSQGGIGLQNVKKRLNILFPDSHQLEIRKTDTFKVDLKVHLK